MEGTGRRFPQVPCMQCKRRQMPWKVSNPRRKPSEKAGSACDHQSGDSFRPTCLKCYSRLQEDDGGCLRCPDPECRGGFSIQPPNPIPSLLKHDIPVTEPSKVTKSQLPLVLRTHCRNCRLENWVCSGSITGPCCTRCEDLGLECDCKVLRKACEECMKDRGNMNWKRCVGFRDRCDSCIEKGIECKEFVRRAEKKELEENQPKDVVADGTMDVIDGMKAIRAFAACERCLEEKLKCDESLPGCRSCGENGVECKYRLLTTTIADFSGKRPKQRRSSLSRVDQEGCQEDSKNEVVPKPGKIPVACRTCRRPMRGLEDRPTCDWCEENSLDDFPPGRSSIPFACQTCRNSKLRCSGAREEGCDRCQKLGLECIPKIKSAGGPVVEKLEEITIESKFEQLENMMSDLELEGWQLVSREEVEEYVLLESGST